MALLLNLPANVMVDGGGGIALLCGASGAIRWPAFAATVAVATAAVPLLFVAGVVGAEWLLP